MVILDQLNIEDEFTVETCRDAKFGVMMYLDGITLDEYEWFFTDVMSWIIKYNKPANILVEYMDVLTAKPISKVFRDFLDYSKYPIVTSIDFERHVRRNVDFISIFFLEEKDFMFFKLTFPINQEFL